MKHRHFPLGSNFLPCTIFTMTFRSVPCVGGTFLAATMCSCVLFAAEVANTVANSPKSPNILWLISEDTGPDFSCYGNPNAVTPHLDKMAAEGVRFSRAFTTGAVCSASRSAFNTGMYQTSIGAHNHRSNRNGENPLPEGVQTISQWMRQVGYQTGNLRTVTDTLQGSGKTDWNFSVPAPLFDFQSSEDITAKQPFFAQINFSETHRAFPSPKRHKPEDMVLPPYYPNDSVMLNDWAAYMESVSVLDDKIGKVMKWLEQEGLLENTVIFYFGDHGHAHVKGKQWVYETGVHVPLIVRWPKNFPAPVQYQPGKVDHRLIDAIDITATSLIIAGLPKPPKMEGQVFYGPTADPDRTYSFGARDRCDETVFQLRTVRDSQYRYIMNLEPGGPFFKTNRYKITQYPMVLRLFKLHDEGKLTPRQEDIFFAPRLPKEELYDLVNDPHEMVNLANDPKYTAVKERLRTTLENWREMTGDTKNMLESAEKIAQEKLTATKNDRNIDAKIEAAGVSHLRSKIIND